MLLTHLNLKRAILIITIIFVMSSFSVLLNANCDMAAMIAKTGYSISSSSVLPGNFDDPDDFFNFLIYYSSANFNPDGYGITYIGENGSFPIINTTDPTDPEFYSDQAWYVTALNITNNNYYYGYNGLYTGPMEAARDAVNNDNNEVVIVLGHDRRSDTAIGNHPLRFIYGTSTFQFIHNGGIDDDIKLALYTELGGESWFDPDNHPSNWNTNTTQYNQFIDSEILFHWIMSNIIDNNGDILAGIQEALTATVNGINLENEFRNPYSTWHNVVNFVLTDGETLFIFKNGYDNWDHHLLSWEETPNNYYAIKTQTELSTSINQFDFVKFTRDEYPVVFPDFFDFDLTNYEIASLSPGWQWVSYPRLDLYNTASYDHAYYSTTYSDPGLLQATEDGNRTINNFHKIEGHRNGVDIDIRYYNGGFHNNGFENKLYRYEGYKIEIEENSPATTIAISGEQLAPTYVIESPLEPDTYHWLGYWLLESQNIVGAFGDLWQYVEKVKAEDWYYDRCTSIRGGDPQSTVTCSTENKTLEYGKGYMVWFIDTPPITDFHWTDSGESEVPVEKAASESFTYTEKPDYEVIDIIDISNNVTEIGVFEDDECVGAVVVQDSCEQILVYSDNVNRDPIPFNFEVVTGRGSSSSIREYEVFNQRTGEFEQGIIISGMQEYSIVRLGEEGEPENIITKTILYANYPNPFNPITKISFSLPKEEDIELAIYNIKGQKVKILYSGIAEEGKHSIIWEGKDTNGKEVSSGLYFYKLKTNKKELTRKMLMLK